MHLARMPGMSLSWVGEMIAILDYDSARPQGLKASLDSLGADALVVTGMADIIRAQKIIFPPGDSFPRMIRWIRDRELIGPLMSAVDDGRPLLGICRGLHLLFDVSYEDGQHTGLGVIPGKVTSFRAAGIANPPAQETAHRGWNAVNWTTECALFDGIPTGTSFYFDHSFFAEPLDAGVTLGNCNHGVQFSAAIGRGAVIATQFMPEQSGDPGMQVLSNFVAI